jgi:hypothetical protein
MGGSGEWTDIIDVETRTRIQRLRNVSIEALTDDFYFLSDRPTTDGLHMGDGGITVRDLATESVRWRYPEPADVRRFSLWEMQALGSLLFVRYLWETSDDDVEEILASFDTLTGARRVLLRQERGGSEEPLSVDFAASTADHLVLGASHRIGFGLGQADYALSILDVRTKELSLDVAIIDPPWLCDYDYCLRD